MSDILIRRTHALTPKKARLAAERIAAQLGEEFDLACEWDGDVLRFRRTGVSGELALHRRELEIRARLGFLLLALKPRIEQEIHRFCDENFGRESKSRV
ncbi:MAG TPA: polyhydroxyalkanoic acid system family protein [Rhodocyclaceae bacterium]|jgi:putative polyhydroxyalkanoate system protein|nr:polyhydroxyalkanoic acid system family protein [Rhodocyclaceae bacterium]